MVSSCFTLASISMEHRLLTSLLIWGPLKSSGGYDLSPLRRHTTRTLHIVLGLEGLCSRPLPLG